MIGTGQHGMDDAGAAPTGRLERWRDWPFTLFAASMPIALAVYLLAGWRLPLWFDEVFTGTIASQPTFAGLIGWCLSELSGPAFYVPMWLWAKLAGASDAALRLPALLLALATPMMIAWRGHALRDVRLFWAALALLWLPMVPMATEARPYPLLVFLCTLQSIAFVRLARAPAMAAAFAWSTAAALAILTHYYAASMVILQGLALLAVHRGQMLRLYPALLPIVAAAVWIGFHLSFLLSFATGHIASYNPMSPLALLVTPHFLFGQGLQGFFVIGLIAFTRPLWWERAKTISPEALLVWTGIIAFASILFVGLFRATLQPRYLTPAVPALLFGIACWANLSRHRQPVPVLLAFAALFAAMIAAPFMTERDDRFIYRRDFQFETASQWLGERDVDRLHFLWSTPTGAQAPSPRLAEIAGFFFRRSGRPVEVIISRGGADPNAALIAAAGADPKAALLWVSDNRLPAGVRPMIDRVNRRWQCRNFGSARFLIYACRRP